MTRRRLARMRLERLFLKSALRSRNPFNSTDDIRTWLTRCSTETEVSIEKIPLRQLRGWCSDQHGNLRHDSGRFFSVEGLSVTTNWRAVPTWQQPIIHQPETGILGILAREMDGVLYFLMQAKIEPGNVNRAQLAPTLQATASNITRVHEGAAPQYLQYFLAHDRHIVFDQLQSEQGARFYRKRNRNMMILIDEPVPVHPGFKWLTLGQLHQLLREDNVVNMDTRTVMSMIPFGDQRNLDALCEPIPTAGSVAHDMLMSCLGVGDSVYDDAQLLSWITELKTKLVLDTQLMALGQVRGWQIGDGLIRHESGDYFRVIAVDVRIAGREVAAWSQPIIEPCHQGIIAFVIKKIGGVLHFLVQAKVECGNRDIIELAPTVLTSHRGPQALGEIPFLRTVLNAPPERVVSRVLQSEEGGRFFRDQNLNLLVYATDDEVSDDRLPELYCWMTARQLKWLVQFSNILGVQARGFLAALSFVEAT